MIYISMILFLVYNYLVFWYSSYVFFSGVKKKRVIVLSVASVAVNGFLLAIAGFFTNFQNESILMVASIVLLTAQLWLIGERSLLEIIFGSLSFCLNLFGIRLMVMSIIALSTDRLIIDCLEDTDTRILINCISFLVPILYISMTKIVMPRKQLDLMIADKKNMKFAIGVLATIYIYMFVNTFSLYARIQTNMLTMLNLKVGICAILGFLLALTYCYLFTKLKAYELQYDELLECVKLEQHQVKGLENVAGIDEFTGLKTREVIEQMLTLYVSQHKVFYVVFIDIDGLKRTNDNYGHEEGDFYIKKVAKTLIETYPLDEIARIGGDEFLILGLDVDQSIQKTHLCREKVVQIQERYQKEYPTSISYGIEQVDKDNGFTAQELMQKADEKMYEFKRLKKRERTVVTPV